MVNTLGSDAHHFLRLPWLHRQGHLHPGHDADSRAAQAALSRGFGGPVDDPQVVDIGK